MSRHPLEEQSKTGRGNVSRQLANRQENLISYHTCLLADEDSDRMHARTSHAADFLWCMCHCNRDV